MNLNTLQQRKETYIHDERHEEILMERYERMRQLPIAMKKGRADEVMSLLREGLLSIETVDRLYTPEEDSSAAVHKQLISLNTMFMMMAFESGVNPLWVHAVSRHYDVMADRIQTPKQAELLIEHMIEDYCDFSLYQGDYTYSDTIQKAIWFLTADPSAKIELEKLAHRLGMSASALSRKFHAETGQTITQYHMTFRIRYAMRLIREMNRTITEVAMQVGFHDASYFSKVFVKYAGQTPTAYRQQVMENEK
ncbi:MAG: AraC family transcriptional regulator [Lachnospiraceae bacterium]|nr:AraC family transcriptional regulator [Lachnospiraceae bacterium]